MKKLLILLGLFIGLTSFAQNPDYHRYGARTKFVQPDTLSTSLRNALSPKLGTLIYHKDTGVSQWEQWNGDSWEELGGDGAVQSVQGYIGVVVINPDDLDDSATTNKFVTATQRGLIDTALQTETDPIFTAWDKDYNDLINKPTIPTSLAAANITVSPAIGGNTDVYAVMDDHEDRINNNEMALGLKQPITSDGPFEDGERTTYNNYATLISNLQAGVINPKQRLVTSTLGEFTEAYNYAQPNLDINLTEHTNISITGTESGDNLILTARNTSSTPRILRLIGIDTLKATLLDEVADFVMITDTLGSRWSRSYKHGFKNNFESVIGNSETVLNFAKNKQIQFVLSSDDEPTFIAPDAPESGLVLYVRQSPIGGDTVTWPVNFINPPTLTSTANRTDVIKLDYDGFYYIASGVVADLDIPYVPPYTSILRLNAGGGAITAGDGYINWVDGSGSSGTGWTYSGGTTSTAPAGITWTRHISIPASMPDADFQTLFDTAKQSGGTQYWNFTVPNGEYKVNVFTGSQANGAQADTVIDITIEGALVLDDGNLESIFGVQTAGMLTYDVTVTDGTINMITYKVSGDLNHYIHGVDIKEKN